MLKANLSHVACQLPDDACPLPLQLPEKSASAKDDETIQKMNNIVFMFPLLKIGSQTHRICNPQSSNFQTAKSRGSVLR